MNESVLERLDDLEESVSALRKLLAGKLPGMLLARCAVSVDKAAASLEKHVEKLSGVAKK